MCYRDFGVLGNILVWNGKIVAGREREANSFRQRIPPDAGFAITDSVAQPAGWYCKRVQLL